MKLEAIHMIYRKPGAKELCHKPGTDSAFFEASEEEGNDLIARGAAKEDVAEKKPAPKKPAAKKPAAKEPVPKAPAKKPAAKEPATKAPTKAAKKDDDLDV